VRDLKVALVPIGRVNFDIPLAEEVTRLFRLQLQAGGLQVIGSEALITGPAVLIIAFLSAITILIKQIG
jgi:hypothetical protein